MNQGPQGTLGDGTWRFPVSYHLPGNAKADSTDDRLGIDSGLCEKEPIARLMNYREHSCGHFYTVAEPWRSPH